MSEVQSNARATHFQPQFFVQCDICRGLAQGKTTASVQTLGEMLEHHALLHEDDDTVLFMVNVRAGFDA